MAQLVNVFKKIVLIIVLISLLISFCAVPSAYAKLDLGDDEFYYAGTQKGQYTVSEGIFEWLLNSIGDIADWLLGIITMGFRMVFVGWTALLEKMLTWALESTSGLNAEGDVIESNTDLTAITDSTNNVTIEAIVYNHVAALDANMFRYERTIDDLKYTGTGHLLKCERDECNKDDKSDVTVCCSQDGTCSCDCKGKCEGCRTYIQAVTEFNENQSSDDAEDPIIIQIKKTVAMWYYIVRTLSIAAMLIVLIFTGIKMAIAVTADQKASYKKMLVDWLVGMIILFAMHYILLFVVYVNESLVHVVEDTAQSINNVQMKQLAEKDSGNKDGVKYSDAEIEQKVYEAVRTRAYDAKLINGLSGMIMYMTLVYFAFRYTIVYLKRLFTIIVLTIMAPAVGVGYAMQKALSGKQMALKTWLTEYVLNIIIQTVHALIYAIFISQALVLSLESIAGVIVALILMNYTLKADKLFRKIFKISTGMVENTQNAADSLKKNLSSAYVGGKSAVRTLTNSPYSNAIKGVGKTAAALPVFAVAGGKAVAKSVKNRASRNSSLDNDTSDEEMSSEESSQNIGSNTNASNNNSDNDTAQDNSSSAGTSVNLPNVKPEIRSDDELLIAGNNQLKENLETAKNKLRNATTPEEHSKALDEYQLARKEYDRFQKISKPSTLDIAKAHGKKFISIENNFELSSDLSVKQNLKNLYHGIYGNKHRDPITGRMVNDGTGYYNQYKLENLFGLTKDDKKALANQFKLAASPIAGLASLMLGMGTVVANPKVGMGLLASGTALTRKSLEKSTHVRTYKGKCYRYAGFGPVAKNNISNIAIDKAKKEYNQLMIDNLKENHPRLYKGLKLGTVTAATISLVGGNIVPAAALGAGAMAIKFRSNTNIGDSLYEFNKNFAKREKEEERTFRKETRNILKADLVSLLQTTYKKEQKEAEQSVEEFMIATYKSLGYEYNPRNGILKKTEHKTKEQEIREEFENKLEEKVKNVSVEEEITYKSQSNGQDLSEADIKYIHKEIDNIIQKMSSGGKIETDSEAFLDDAMKELTNKLIVQNIISDKQTAEVVFKRGKEGLKTELKNKAHISNVKIEIAEQALSGISEEDQEQIKKIVKQDVEQNKITDYNQIDASSIVKKINKDKQPKNPNTKKQTKISNNQRNSQSQDSQDTQGLSAEQQTVYTQKVAEYLSNLQAAKTAMNNKDYAKKQKIKREVEVKAKSRKKRKLKQILEMSLEPDFDLDNMINQVENEKKSNKSNVTDDSARVLTMLFAMKGLRELNEYDMTSKELKNGSVKYLNAKKEESKAKVAYDNQKLEVIRYQLKNSRIYNDSNYRNRTDIYSREEIEERERIEEIEEKTLKKLEAKLEKAKHKTKLTGPIVDNEAEIKKILKK